MAGEYLSLKEPASAQSVVKRSKFICQLMPVQTPEEAEDFLASVRKEHYDATHNCSAAVIGPDAEYVKASDDGEPQGTAGIPMLDVLRKSQVRNVIAVVTRYFGGTLLGAGGLVRAYSGSVSGTLANAAVVKNVPGVMYTFHVPYQDYGKLQSIAAGFGAAVDGTFTEDVRVTVTLRKDQASAFTERMNQALLGKLRIDRMDECVLEEPAAVRASADE